MVGALLAVGFVVAGATGTTPTLELELLVTSAGAEALAFVPDTLVAPAGTTVRIVFRNAATVSHNLTFQAPLSVGTATIVEPGATDSVVLRTPGRGDYVFVCTIHMGMSGTLRVE
jgi:plastocyanin